MPALAVVSLLAAANAYLQSPALSMATEVPLRLALFSKLHSKTTIYVVGTDVQARSSVSSLPWNTSDTGSAQYILVFHGC